MKLQHTYLQKIRHYAKRFWLANRVYDSSTMLFQPTYHSDGLITTHNADFIRDPKFSAAYETALRQRFRKSIPVQWRVQVILWAASQAQKLEGDFVECGVDRAFMASAIVQYLDFANLQNKSFYLFDTFCGLVNELVKKHETAAHKNEYIDSYSFVVKTFEKFTNVKIIKGVVPESLTEVNIEKVAYLHIDMNCAEPERAALEFFWPKIVPGGVIVLDDYGFRGHEAQKEAADEFAKSISANVLSLPTGQALIIKSPR